MPRYNRGGSLAAGKYDLAWLSRVESYVAFHASISAPTVVDFDDLEDRWSCFTHREFHRIGAGPDPGMKAAG